MDTPTPPEVRRPYIDFGERLSASMAAADVSSPRLAGMLEISSQMVGRYLRGESLPGPQRLRAICAILGADMATLLGEHSFPSPGRAPRGSLRPSVVTERPIFQYQTLTTTPEDEPEAVEVPFTLTAPEARTRLASNPWTSIRKVERELSHATRDLLRDLVTDAHPFDDFDVLTEYRVRGPYGRIPVDIVVTHDKHPVLCVEIRSGIGAAVSGLIGTAHSWKVATGGKPLFVIWLVPELPTDRAITYLSRIENQLRGLSHPEGDFPPIADDVFVLQVENETVDPSRFRERMAAVISALD